MFDNILPYEILALTIYGEARGESVEGQIAVANVIVNRWKNNPTKYKNVRDVCLQDEQFSCWNENDPNYPLLVDLSKSIESGGKLNPIMKQCLYIANGVMGSNLTDNTKGAKYYMTTELLNSNKRPSWANGRVGEIEIGNHTFFNV